ncbi:MAG: RNA-directed DNA polymerase [Pirellulales bacterium]|nr:RNA-directed DNA polymerase [Pirellulales bacterium]
MSFLDWLKSLFRPKPATRIVAGLSAADTSADAAKVREVVDTSGGPLKPGHCRRALRDSRLLPKPKPKSQGYVWPRPPKPKYLDRSEADRLFSTTLRCRDRNLRDLLPDPEQLDRYGLPLWQTEADLAEALGISVGMLRHYSLHRIRETTPHYVTFAIPKRSGGERLIHAPKRRLKAIQRRLHELLVSRLPVSAAAHGFRSGRSVATNAHPHINKAVLIKLDLKDCFPSIHFGRVRGLLVALGYGYQVATVLAVLMTEPPRQPVEIDGKLVYVPVGPRSCVQGAPTSPGLCNAVLLRLDRRLAGLARKYGFAYTRYADDLTFSGDDTAKIKLMITLSSKIVREEGFSLNRQKTRVLRRSRRQTVAGVVVNSTVGLSRRDRRRLRAEIHQLSQAAKPPDSHRVQRLAGKLAYLHMLNADQAAPLLVQFARLGDGS